jgi:hypothetical protein
MMIPERCILVGDRAFQRRCLKEAVIPASCQIGEAAFCECKELTIVAIGHGCHAIGECTVDSCPLLASVTPPSTVHSIGKYGFARCTALATIAVPKDCQLHEGAFYLCSPVVATF